MTTPRIVFTSVALAALLAPGAALAAGSLTRADFERCNQQAMQVAGISDSQSPSASPSMPGSGAGTSGSVSGGTGSSGIPGSSIGGSSGAGASGSPSTGGVSGSAGSVTGSGTYGGADQMKLDRAVQAYRDCLQQ